MSKAVEVDWDKWNENEQREQRMRYLGVLGILSECSPYVPEDIRETIERAFEDACEDGLLRWKRVLDRYEIEPVWDET